MDTPSWLPTTCTLLRVIAMSYVCLSGLYIPTISYRWQALYLTLRFSRLPHFACRLRKRVHRGSFKEMLDETPLNCTFMEKEGALYSAERSLAQGQSAAALKAYFLAAKQDPACLLRMRENFLRALASVLDELRAGEDADDFQQLLLQVKAVVATFPSDDLVLTMLGRKCLEEGLYHLGEQLLRAALQAEPDCLTARDILQVLNEFVLERWHFRMVNDIARNSAYFESLKNVLVRIPDCTVLDIGSGTGLLSMMAVQLGAKKVYACDVNEPLVAMSRDIIAANRMQDDITLIPSLSSNLSVPNGLPQRVSLVVTETVGSGLLEEGIIPTLKHAWRELLLPRKPSELTNQIQESSCGHVIPCGATVYAVAIECPQIQRQSKLLTPEVGGLSLGSIVLEGTTEGAEGFQPMEELARELFARVRLNLLRGGYRMLTKIYSTLEFDFNNPELPLPENHLELSVVAGGQVDAIAMWFDLNLDSCISFCTSPTWDTSFEQAAFPVEEGMVVEKGDVLLLHASCPSETQISMKLEKVMKERESVGLQSRAGVSEVRATEGLETVMEVEEAVATAAQDGEVFYVERGDLTRLNDAVYLKTYRKALSRAINDDISADSASELDDDGGGTEGGSSSEEEEEEFADSIVLDMARGMSVLGHMAAKEGADFVQIARTPGTYRVLSGELARRNGVEGRVTFKHLELSSVSVGYPMWDVVVCDLVSPQGMLHSGVLAELGFLRSRYLHSEGLIVPGQVEVHATCISSATLRAETKVLGTVPTLDFDIARFINQYEVTHYIDIDLASFPHTPLTDSFPLLTLDLNTPGGGALEAEGKVPVPVKSAGTMVGIAYWFSLRLHGDITISTGPGAYSGSHWHQSVFLLPEDQSVQRGQQLEVRGLLRDSCLHIALL